MTPDPLVIIISTQLLKKTLWPTFDNKLGTTPIVKESSVPEWSSRTTNNSCACYTLTVSVLLFFQRMEHTQRSSGLQVICYIIVYFLPDPLSITRQAHKDTTAQPAAVLLFDSSVSYPVLPPACRGMLLHNSLACESFALLFALSFSLQIYFISTLDSDYLNEYLMKFPPIGNQMKQPRN